MSNLTMYSVKHAFENLSKERNKRNRNRYFIALSLGYLEASLQSFGVLQTEMIDDVKSVKRELIKSDKWWKSDRKETYEESIVRQVKKLISDNE